MTMGVSVGESPAGPNTPGFLGFEDLEAGSMRELCYNPRIGGFSSLPLLCAVHGNWRQSPLVTGSDRVPS